MISHTRQGVRFVTGIGFCVLRYQGVRFVTGIGFCVLWCHTRERGYDLLRVLGSDFLQAFGLRFVIHETGGRDRGYDLLRALGSASCDMT